MKLVLQRASRARLTIEGEARAEFDGPGLVVLFGAGRGDAPPEAPAGAALLRKLADKLVQMRIFPDDVGKMNRSVQDAGGSLLIVSQFTLFAETKKGNRPGFSGAAKPELAIPLYEAFVRLCEERLPGRVQTGVFAADMQVELVNDGPVTIVIDTDDWR